MRHTHIVGRTSTEFCDVLSSEDTGKPGGGTMLERIIKFQDLRPVGGELVSTRVQSGVCR